MQIAANCWGLLGIAGTAKQAVTRRGSKAIAVI